MPGFAPHGCVLRQDGVELPPADVGRDQDGGSPAGLCSRHAGLVQFTGDEVDSSGGDPADCGGDLGVGDVAEQLRDRIGAVRVCQDHTEQEAQSLVRLGDGGEGVDHGGCLLLLPQLERGTD